MPRLTENEYFNDLIETHRNGNISDFKEAVKKMDKGKALRFYWHLECTGYKDGKQTIWYMYEN